MVQNTYPRLIDREEQLEAFQLLLDPDNPRWVLAIAGDSGTGKSYLLKYLRDFETPSGYLKVWVDVANARLRTDPLALLRAFGEALRPKMSDKVWNVFKRTHIDQERALVTLRRTLNIHQELIASGGGQVSKVTQTLGEGLVVREAVNRARNVTTLTLLDALETIVSNEVIIFLDSFEWLQESADVVYLDWLLGEVLGLGYERLQGRLRTVVAGRRPLGDSPLADSTVQHYLGLFDEEMHSAMLQSRGIRDVSLINAIYDITQGHPLLTDITAHLWDETGRDWKVSDLKKLRPEFDARARSEWVLGRVIQHLEVPYGDLLRYGAILRRFDFDTMQAVFPEWIREDERVFLRLIDYSFVRSLPGGWYAFHELVQTIQASYLRRHMSKTFEKYHQRALAYYQQLAQSENHQQTHENGTVAAYPVQIEILYHLTATDERKGLDYFRALFKTAVRSHNLPFARVLLEEMRSYELRKRATRDWLDYYNGLWAYLTDDWNLARDILFELSTKQKLTAELGAALFETLADLIFKQGHTHAALDYYLQGVAIRESIGDNIGLAYILASVGSGVYRALGEWSRAEDCLKQSISILENLAGEEQGLARAILQLSNLYRLESRWDEAIELLEQSVKLYEQIGNKYYAAIASLTLGRTQMQKGDLAAAEASHLGAVELLTEIGVHYGYGMALRNVGDVYRMQGRNEEAEKQYLESLSLFERVDAQLEWARVIGDLGTLYFQMGRIDEAIRHYHICLDKKQELRDNYGIAITSCYLGNLWRNQKQWQKAISCYERALDIFQRHPNAQMKVQTIIGLCYAYLAVGRNSDTAPLLDAGTQIAQDFELADLSELYHLRDSLAAPGEK